jgi:hypothetical protein
MNILEARMVLTLGRYFLGRTPASDAAEAWRGLVGRAGGAVFRCNGGPVSVGLPEPDADGMPGRAMNDAINALIDALPAAGAPATWPAGRDPHDHPDLLADVLVWRADARLGEAYGWDFAYVGTGGRWHSATGGGEEIPPPALWWALPGEVTDAR